MMGRFLRALCAFVVCTFIAACGGVVGRLERSIERGEAGEAVSLAEGWLERRPEDHNKRAQVSTLLETARFDEARSLDTVAAYRAFLADYPASIRRESVRTELARVEFDSRVRRVDTLEAYAAFLQEFPSGPQADLARARSVRLAWRNADGAASQSAYVAFAETYPGYEESVFALSKVRSLAWRELARRFTVEGVIAYVEEFPDDPANGALMRYAESMAWDEARTADTIEGYARFVTLFDESVHADDAWARAEARAWRDAEEEDVESGYRAFVEAFPGSAHAGVAETRASDLRLYYGSADAGELATTITQIDARDPDTTTVYVDVRDGNGVLISGLNGDDMDVLEGGSRVEVVDVVGMERNRPLDVVFAIDASGSMRDDIDALANATLAFAQVLNNRQRDVRFGLVTFVREAYAFEDRELTADPAEFQVWVRQLYALANGGYVPEVPLDVNNGEENPALALELARRADWRDDAQRVVILMTDEHPNVAYDRNIRATTAASAARMAEEGMSLYLIVPDLPEYHAVQAVSGGVRYDIEQMRASGASALVRIADRLSLQYQVTYRRPETTRRHGTGPRVRVFKPSIWLEAGALPGDEVVALMTDPDDGCRVLAILQTEGVFRSHDCANTWEQAGGERLRIRAASGAYGENRILYLLTDDGSLWTMSGLEGNPLRRDIALDDVEHIAWVESRSHEVWAVSDGQLHVSYENALGFVPHSELPSGMNVQSIRVDPHASDRLCGWGEGAVWCVDGSRSWRRLAPIAGGEAREVSMCPWRSGLYFIVVDGVLYRTLDAGRSWMPANVPGSGYGRISYGPSGTQRVCVATDDGTYCSEDDGVNWRPIAGETIGDRWRWTTVRPGGGLYSVSQTGGNVQRLGSVATREFLGSALFDVDESEPYDSALPLIESVGQTLRDNPEYRALVEGHTDSDGDSDYNLELSDQRANAVAFLLVQAGAAGSQVDAVGHGEERPLFPNDSDANKQANRRVEITIYGEM